MREKGLFLAILGAATIAVFVAGVLVSTTRDPAEDYWREAAEMLSEGDEAGARILLELIVERYPESEHAEEAADLLGVRDRPLRETGTPEALFREARSFYPMGSGSPHDLAMAADLYMAVADSYPDHPLARDAMYEAAVCFDNLGDVDRSITVWEEFASRYPTDPRMPEVIYGLGYLYQNVRNDLDRAAEYYRMVLERYPLSNVARDAETYMNEINGLGAAASPTSPGGGEEGVPSVSTLPGGM